MRNVAPLKILIAALCLTALLLALLGYFLFDSYRLTQRQFQEGSRLKELVGTITHLDEVLTMSARMAAMTGDKRWENRHKRYEPKLKDAIEEAIRLVELEQRAFESVRAGRLEEARGLLFSSDYERSKELYARGMRELAVSLSLRSEGLLAGLRKRAYLCGLLGLGMFLFLAVGWVSVIRLLERWEKLLEEKNRELTEQAGKTAMINTQLDLRVQERTSELAKANVNLEREIAERMKAERDLEAKVRELELLNRVMMGREERILELKRQLKGSGEGRAA